MDKRYDALPLPEQLSLRRQAIEDVLAHPEWSSRESVRHLKKTVQDIEQGRSDGTVQTMNRIFGMPGLKLGVVRQNT
ncbi:MULTISPECIES: transcriptional regulator [Burkholderia]|uniref:XRE family transcriptional regulator n=1 Tax=Burkholderia aenigmatica TaxID=2015348 RepID=A0A6J5J9F8_9BURK|nr:MULTISPECIES: transcriptional regulator [Burkholderia]CAB3968139.1 XRE family transcriptional regulator [Burkholderia aenigmatica]